MTSAKQKAAKAAAQASQAKTSVKVAEPAASGWSVEGVVRLIILFFAATLPFYYDLGVPEVSGDIRWLATEFFAGVCAILLLSKALWTGDKVMSLRWPVVMWFGLGLAIWSAVSLIDALNPSRGIILIKALYAQLILMVVVYHVATPGFGRKLLWALALPMFGTSLVGVLQFHGMSDTGLQALMNESWLWVWLKPFVWVLNGLAGTIAEWVGWGERQLGFVGLITNTFLQSAVPGSTFANKNLAGSWTAMMLPIALYLLITAKRWPAQAVASILLAMGSVFLIYSRARASWVALFCALMTLGALLVLVPAWRKAIWSHLDKSHILWLLLPVVCLIRWGGDVSPINGGHAIDRTPAQQVEALTQSSWNEIGGRLAYNLNSLVIIKDYWFNGVGLGNFYTIYPPYYNELVVTPTNSYNVMARPQRTHTDMMQSFDEMGIPGGILYVGLFVSAISMALRMAGRRAGALGGYLIGAGMVGMMAGLTVFLEQQGMLALPGVWHWLLVTLQLIVLSGLGFGAIYHWLKLREKGDWPVEAAFFNLIALGGCEAILPILLYPSISTFILIWVLRIGLAATSLTFIILAIQQHLKNPQKASTNAADDSQLLGLMTGIGVLTICINALFDFPMQLPTAPAAAMLMMGLISALYMRYYPQAVTAPLANCLPERVKVSRGVILLGVLVTLAASGWAMWDGLKFRESNVLLKQGMIRIYSGLNDDATLEILQRAWDVYPYDQRIQEHLGVVYANYNGVMPLSLNERIAKLEWVLAGDPWGANHMINLSGLYLQQATQQRSVGNVEGALKSLTRADELFEKLKENADFSHYTWGIGGTLRNMQGRFGDAIWMFRRALAIEPSYTPALYGLQMAVSASGLRPATVQDGSFRP
ncbi:MAG: hypothetical protein DI628_02460 [Blastochloris viridis]|uniref:Tetratricopeptide repeat protein n=1 Tax=Blastochloris viridis TaxID=1079 RepID=A0A6N4R3B8_BLAVI|nr:MAG: hypothetical protein DI628_02460 [Blastochloris viridis]